MHDISEWYVNAGYIVKENFEHTHNNYYSAFLADYIKVK